MKKNQKTNTELHDIQSLPQDVIAYSLVLHDIRIKLNLSLNDYCVADSIYHLSANPHNKMQGWCYMGRENMAKMLGLTKDGINKIIKKLVHEGLVERPTPNDTSNLVRTTEKWYDEVVTRRMRLNTIYKTKTKIIKSKKITTE